MKTLLLFLICLTVFTARYTAQTYSPVAVTGYNLDAIAESSPAYASTNGIIDGSDYVLYSYAYGTVFGTGEGLPDNGTITNGSRTYQMNSFSANNTCFVGVGLKDSIIMVTPAPYAALSLLGLATEGSAGMNVTVKFTDGTAQVFSSLTMPDWFYNPNAIISGFDRTGRSMDSPDYQFGQPNMYAVDLTLSCANRAKNVQKIVIENTTTNPRICVFAVSGAALPTYSVTSSNVTCNGGANGSATVTTTGGLPAYTYTWTTSPVQNSATASNLPAGTFTVTVKDAASCTNTISATVTQPTLVVTTTVSASSTTLCAGSSLTLTTSGAVTYTWSNSASTATAVINPVTSATYSVVGTTSLNCHVTGSISITVNPLPVISFSLTQNSFCTGASSINLNAAPSGGTFSGAGVSGTVFSPATAGVGTHTISYSYTNANNCTANTIVSNTITTSPVVTFSLFPNTFCSNSPSVALNATPAGGTYTGAGVSGSGFSPATAGIGTHTVSYMYTDANNCSASAVASATVDACTGIEELQATSVVLFPNPNRGNFSIKAVSAINLVIVNETGQILRRVELNANNNNSVSIENLPEGIYIVIGQNSRQMIKQKIIITN